MNKEKGALADDIELSFCIATFNREKSIRELVESILLCNNKNIEVVVLDNGSTDNTLSVLHSINDERLKVYSNGENKGSLFNIVNVVNKGEGEFIIFMTDKDHVFFKNINEFKNNILKIPNLACGYCALNSAFKRESEVFIKGYQAIKKVAYQGGHPTGYFFNKKLLRSINITDRFADRDFVGDFPFEFVLAELCVMGNGLIYHNPLFTTEAVTIAAKHKSFSIDGKSKEAYFSPESRLKIVISYTNHILTLDISMKEKKFLIVDVFSRGLLAATVGYRSILRNEYICAHYHMVTRELNIKDIFIIGKSFYSVFIVEYEYIIGVTYNEKIKFNFLILIFFIKKIINRLIFLVSYR